MKTTLNFDDGLIRAAKVRAAGDGETLTCLINRAVRQYLATTEPPKEPFKLKLFTKSGRLLPGVNLEDRKSLYDIMDGLD